MRATLLIVTLALSAGVTPGQAIFVENEVAAFLNDTFATSQDCIGIGNDFQIQGSYIQGDPNCDKDYYRFMGDMGATIDIVMTITVSVSTSPGQPYQQILYLFDSSERLVASWNSTSAYAGSPTIRISTYTLPATEVYTIAIGEWSVAANALAQGGLTWTALATGGFGCVGAMPDSTFNTAGGNQIYGSQYTIDVDLSSGNDSLSPSCMWLAPLAPATLGDVVTCEISADDPQGDPVVVTWEWSSDAGVTFSPCTAGPSSPLPNPSAPQPTPAASLVFDWDSRIDGLGFAAPQTVDLRATVFDGVRTQTCSVSGITIDNTMACNGICGDCDLNALGPTILDALTAAQIAAALRTPTMVQTACCDVNASTLVDILDALVIAQAAAALPVTLNCL